MERFEKIVLDHPLVVLVMTLGLSVWFAFYIPGIKVSSSSDRFFIAGDPDKVYFDRAKQLFGNDQVVVIAMIAPEGETIYTRERIEKLDRLTRDIASIEGVDVAVSLANVPAIRAPRDPQTGGFKKAIEVTRLIPHIPESLQQWEELKNQVNRNPLYKGNLVSQDGRAAAVVAFIHDFESQAERYKGIMAAINSYMKAAGAGSEERFCVAGVPATRVEIEKYMIRDLKLLLPITFAFITVVLYISFRRITGVAAPLLTILVTTLWTMSFMEAADIPLTLVTMILPILMLALGSSYSIHLMSDYINEARPGLDVKDNVKRSVSKVALPIVVCGVTTIVGFGSLVLNRIPAIQDLGYASVVGIFFAVSVSILVIPASLMLLRRKPSAGGRPKESPLLDVFLDRVAAMNIKRRRIIFAVAAALVVISIFGIRRVKIDTDFLSFFPEDGPVREAVRVQTKHLAGAAPFNIVIEADRADVFKHPAMLKRMEELQRWAEQEVEGIDTTLSIADYVKLLSQAFHRNDPDFYRIPASQKEVSQMLFLYFSSGSPEDFAPYITQDFSAANILIRSRLVGSTETNRAIKKIEARANELFRPPERPPLPRGEVPAQVPAPVREEGAVSWGEKGGGEEVQWEDDSPAGDEESVPWEEGSGESEKGASEVLWEDEDAAGPMAAQGEPASSALPVPPESEFPWPHVQVNVTGTIYLMNKSADAVSKGQITGLGTALAAIFIIMSLLFLSPKVGFLAMLPNIFPMFILFGFMGFSGITLNFSTSLIAAIALGIGVDDTIQYINSFNMELSRTRDQTEAMIIALKAMGKPMIYTSAALFSGFIILVFSDFVPVKQFGFLAAVILVVALSSDLFILPTLMISVRFVTLWDLLALELGDSPARYIKIFSGLTNHQAKVAVLMGHVVKYRDKELIYKEGDVGSEMYVVLKGYVNIVNEERGHEVNLFTVQPGGSFGEVALLHHATRSASARAEGWVKLLVLDEQVLFRLQKRYPRISSQIFYNITHILAERLERASEQMVECTVDLDELGSRADQEKQEGA